MSSTLTSPEAKFLEQLAKNSQSWLESATDALEGRGNVEEWSDCPEAWKSLVAALPSGEARAAFKLVLQELLSGVSHSFLATLDGTTSLAESVQLEVTLPLFRVVLNPRFTRPFCAVPRTSVVRTASG